MSDTFNVTNVISQSLSVIWKIQLFSEVKKSSESIITLMKETYIKCGIQLYTKHIKSL